MSREDRLRSKPMIQDYDSILWSPGTQVGQHVYNDAPFRQISTLVVDSHSSLSYRHC